jgi:hypothetical protein
LGITKQAAHQLVSRALRDLICQGQVAAAELLDIELRRTDALREAMFPRVAKGSAAAADVCLRVLAQRARLLGVEPHPADGGPPPRAAGLAWRRRRPARRRGCKRPRAARPRAQPSRVPGTTGAAEGSR